MISSRVEEKSKEGSTVIAGGLEDEGAEVGLVDEKGGPVGGGFLGGEGKARARRGKALAFFAISSSVSRESASLN